MAKKSKNKIEKMSYAEWLLHIPNPMHLEACKRGGNVYRNKKKYTRKEKYKSKYY